MQHCLTPENAQDLLDRLHKVVPVQHAH